MAQRTPTTTIGFRILGRKGTDDQRFFYAAAALLFAASTVGTIVWCRSMSDMDGMTMPGGWTMEMTWMPGKAWAGPAAVFLGMWVLMMAAMMLPSLTPMLLRYRSSVRIASGLRLSGLTALVTTGYFLVWAAVGAAIYPLGVELAKIEMQREDVSRAVPMITAIVVLLAGLLQFSQWKLRALDCCRGSAPTENDSLTANVAAALRQGICYGVHCNACCAGFTAVLLALGVMDLRMMALVTLAISAERLAPSAKTVARIIGMLLIGLGLVMILRTSGLA